jgi:hypothetical protein
MLALAASRTYPEVVPSRGQDPRNYTEDGAPDAQDLHDYTEVAVSPGQDPRDFTEVVDQGSKNLRNISEISGVAVMSGVTFSLRQRRNTKILVIDVFRQSLIWERPGSFSRGALA